MLPDEIKCRIFPELGHNVIAYSWKYEYSVWSVYHYKGFHAPLTRPTPPPSQIKFPSLAKGMAVMTLHCV
jgi:hypothetical protein